MVTKRLTRQERWAKAGQMQDVYNSTYNTNISKREFYKNDNPFTQRLIKYDVTYSMNISGNSKKMGGSYEFYIPQDTYSVYVFNDVETQSEIKERTQSQISDIFKGNARTLVYNKTDVSVVRGVETNSINYSEIDVKQVEHDMNSKQHITKNIEVHSKRRNVHNKSEYTLDIWL